MASRRSVVVVIWAGRSLALMSRSASWATMSRLVAEMSIKAKWVSANSGTASMSCMSLRVKPIEPAPIMAIFNGMEFLLFDP